MKVSWFGDKLSRKHSEIGVPSKEKVPSNHFCQQEMNTSGWKWKKTPKRNNKTKLKTKGCPSRQRKGLNKCYILKLQNLNPPTRLYGQEAMMMAALFVSGRGADGGFSAPSHLGSASQVWGRPPLTPQTEKNQSQKKFKGIK